MKRIVVSAVVLAAIFVGGAVFFAGAFLLCYVNQCI